MQNEAKFRTEAEIRNEVTNRLKRRGLLLLNGGLGVLAVFGGIAGLLGSGLATLRADHDPYVAEVLDALHEGESAVVVRALSVDQRRRARAILEQAGSGTTATM